MQYVLSVRVSLPRISQQIGGNDRTNLAVNPVNPQIVERSWKCNTGFINLPRWDVEIGLVSICLAL